MPPPRSSPRGESKSLLNSATVAANNNNAGGGGFKHGEGGDTDEFLAGLTGGKPKYRPAAKHYEPSVDTDNSDAIPSNYYAPDYRPEYGKKGKTCGVDHCASRAAIIVVAMILMGGGGAIVAFLNHNMEYLKDLWPLAYYAMNALGGLYIVGGIVSIVAAVRDSDKLRRAALFVMVLACSGVIMGFMFATFVRNGREDNGLLSDWSTMVSEDPGRVCTIEHDLNCTGWTLPCNATSTSYGDIHLHDLVNALALEDILASFQQKQLGNSTAPRQCVYSCNLDAFHNMNQTCSSALQARVRKDYPAAVAALAFSLMWTLAFGGLVFLRRDVVTGYGNIQSA